MTNPDLTDDPSQHQPSPVEEARASAGEKPTPPRAEELAAFGRLIERTQAEYQMVCDLGLRLGGSPGAVQMARNNLALGIQQLRIAMPEGA